MNQTIGAILVIGLATYLATGLVVAASYIARHSTKKPAERIAIGILVIVFWPLLKGKW